MWGPENARGRKGPHALAPALWPVAFRAALGDCLGSSTLIAAVFAHLTDATGTEGDFEGKITSIEASFDFHPSGSKPASYKRATGAQFRGSIKRGNAMDFESPRSGSSLFCCEAGRMTCWSDKSWTRTPYSLFKFDLEWMLYLATSKPSGMFIF